MAKRPAQPSWQGTRAGWVEEKKAGTSLPFLAALQAAVPQEKELVLILGGSEELAATRGEGRQEAAGAGRGGRLLVGIRLKPVHIGAETLAEALQGFPRQLVGPQRLWFTRGFVQG
jgi:hypothetical protein